MGKKSSEWNELDGNGVFAIPRTLLTHDNFRRLSPYGNKLINDLARQFTGYNNGYLCCAWTLMKGEGWRSPSTLAEAANECRYYGLICRTQQGGKNKPNLYAFTWRRINEKKDRPPLDARPTLAPSNEWKDAKPLFTRTKGKRKVGAGRKRGRPAVRRAG